MLQRIPLTFHLTPFNHIIRNSSFKVINAGFDIKDQALQAAKVRSENIRKVLDQSLTVIHAGGGQKAVHRHTVINKKLLVRERLKLLIDEDSPVLEIGALAGMFMDYGSVPAAGSVTVIGKIHGHYCIIGACDATVKGGTAFPITVAKQIRMQQLSFLNKLPGIYMIDSGGAFLPLQADIFPGKEHGGRTFYNEAVLSGAGIPQIAIVCGSSTAGAAYCPTMAEEAIIVKKLGTIFLAGPPLVKAATGEVVSDQDLGGADVHCRISGCTDHFAENEEEAFEMCRESVLTMNLPKESEEKEFPQPLYPIEGLSILSGKRVLSKSDMYEILCRILDGSMFKEFKMNFGANLITGFGFICGKLIGIIANSGYITFRDAQKGAHFIQLCSKRNVPLVFLQNSGLYECPEDCNLEGVTLRERAKFISAHSSSKLPKITLNVGGCFGDDNFTMCGWSFQPNFLFSWPLADSSLSRNAKASPSSDDHNFSYESVFENKSSSFFKSSRMLQDGIVMPEHTREVLSMCINIVTRTRCQQIGKDTFNIMRM